MSAVASVAVDPFICNSLSPQTKSNVNDLSFWSTLVVLSR